MRARHARPTCMPAALAPPRVRLGRRDGGQRLLEAVVARPRRHHRLRRTQHSSRAPPPDRPPARRPAAPAGARAAPHTVRNADRPRTAAHPLPGTTLASGHTPASEHPLAAPCPARARLCTSSCGSAGTATTLPQANLAPTSKYTLQVNTLPYDIYPISTLHPLASPRPARPRLHLLLRQREHRKHTPASLPPPYHTLTPPGARAPAPPPAAAPAPRPRSRAGAGGGTRWRRPAGRPPRARPRTWPPQPPAGPQSPPRTRRAATRARPRPAGTGAGQGATRCRLPKRGAGPALGAARRGRAPCLRAARRSARGAAGARAPLDSAAGPARCRAGAGRAMQIGFRV